MKKLVSIILIINLLMFSVSCQKEKEKATQIKKENNVPKQLGAIMDTVDEIEVKLLELKKETEKTEQVEVQKEKEEMIKKLQKEQKPEEETSKVENELKTVKTYQEKIQNMWTNLEKEIESTHTKVNDYKIKAVEDKANEKRIEGFEENLNNLTISIENKDLLNSFISNNQMYSDISYFMSLYKTYRSKIIELKYSINNVYISGLKNEWDKALEGIEQVDNQYSEALKEFNKEVKEKEKPSEDDKKKEKDLEKLKLSIDSLKQSLSKKDVKLLEIKRDVVVFDIERVKE